MGASQQMLMAGGSGVVGQFSAWEVWGDSAVGVMANASFFLNASGTVQSSVTDSDGGGTDGTLEWYLPVTTGVGASYWVRFTPTTGTFTSNSASTWTSLSTQQNCQKQATTGTDSVTFTIQIAADAAGSVVLMTSTGNVLRYTHT